MNDAVIRLEHISKRFGSNTALSDVSLEVQSGQVFAVLGENGAGKTTAIRILLGLERCDDGVAEVLGLNSAKQGREIRSRVGYVAETPSLYPWMTVRETGWFAAGFYVEESYLDNYLDRMRAFDVPLAARIKSLSKGMRSKVSLGLALAHEPAVLILDEPTSGLDALVRREFLESMVSLAAEGRTVLLSSHQIHEVERVADRIGIIRDGKLLFVESLDSLKAGCRQVILTLDHQDAIVPLPWTVIDARRRGRQRQILVSDWDASRISDLQQQDGVTVIDSHPPSLEEIFVAYMRQSPDKPSSNSPIAGDEVLS